MPDCEEIKQWSSISGNKEIYGKATLVTSDKEGWDKIRHESAGQELFGIEHYKH